MIGPDPDPCEYITASRSNKDYETGARTGDSRVNEGLEIVHGAS